MGGVRGGAVGRDIIMYIDIGMVWGYSVHVLVQNFISYFVCF